MLPILDITSTAKSVRLHDILRHRAAGALDAYYALVAEWGHRSDIPDTVWAVYRGYVDAQNALWDAEAVYWEEAESRLNAGTPNVCAVNDETCTAYRIPAFQTPFCLNHQQH